MKMKNVIMTLAIVAVAASSAMAAEVFNETWNSVSVGVAPTFFDPGVALTGDVTGADNTWNYTITAGSVADGFIDTPTTSTNSRAVARTATTGDGTDNYILVGTLPSTFDASAGLITLKAQAQPLAWPNSTPWVIVSVGDSADFSASGVYFCLGTSEVPENKKPMFAVGVNNPSDYETAGIDSGDGVIWSGFSPTLDQTYLDVVATFSVGAGSTDVTLSVTRKDSDTEIQTLSGTISAVPSNTTFNAVRVFYERRSQWAVDNIIVDAPPTAIDEWRLY